MEEQILSEELNQCENNIKRLLSTKKEYEDKLFCENDPRNKERWKNEINAIDEDITRSSRKFKHLKDKLIKKNGGNNTYVQFVIAAMTRGEASELNSGEAFKGTKVTAEERAKFLQFKEELKKNGAGDFVSHYGQLRENWIPYSELGESIGQILKEIYDHINSNYRTKHSNLIQPISVSMEFFDDDDRAKRLECWHRLKQLGGVLIIDALSLYHPSLRRKISSSGISSEHSVGMLVLSPISNKNLNVNNLVSELIKEEMEDAYYSRYENLDVQCWIGIDDLMDLKRCLSAVLQKKVDSIHNPRANPVKLEMFQNKQGPTQGMSDLIFKPIGV